MNGFDDILKNKLENYREMPSQDVFLKIRSQYPKPGIKDFLGRYKYYFIAAVATVVIVTGIIILGKETKNNQLQNTETQSNQVVLNNNNIDVSVSKKVVEDNVLKPINNVISGNYSESKEDVVILESKVKEIVYKNVFGFEDTAICGFQVETEFEGNFNSIVLPENVKAIKLDNIIKFVSSCQGSYIVYYSEFMDNINVRDSVNITFNTAQSAEVSLSKEELCPGQELLINVRSNQFEPVWNSNLNVNRRAKSEYSVSGLKPGKNVVSFTINDNNGCIQNYSKTVNVFSPLSIDYFSTPNVCSGSNATLIINTTGHHANLFKLNNNIESKTGYFKGLDPGIYVLSVEYQHGCVVRDTLFIRDSLNISPYFIAEKDLLNRNKYSFRNLTNVDDRGYERNANVSFVWKVNGNVFSVEDNPEFEFIKEGHNVVELIASINENCQNIYSETIFISGSNFRIPNIFTPNGDGIGDEFVVVYEGELSGYKLDIINRSGEVVFESSQIRNSWDGKINGNDDAAEGLYYYIIRGEDKFGNNIEQKGSLQLVRN